MISWIGWKKPVRGTDSNKAFNTFCTDNFWCLVEGQVTEKLGEEIRNVSKRFGRANWEALKTVAKETAEESDRNKKYARICEI